VIVCGSREYGHPELVYEVIKLMTLSCHRNNRRLVVVHGACPTGADKAASKAVLKLQREGYSVVEEPHPADWKPQGNGAGPVGNTKMGALGGRLCVAFWEGRLVSSRGGTPGTLDMASKATKAKLAPIPLVFPVAHQAALALLRPLFEALGTMP